MNIIQLVSKWFLPAKKFLTFNKVKTMLKLKMSDLTVMNSIEAVVKIKPKINEPGCSKLR